jgi:hypothetical protein
MKVTLGKDGLEKSWQASFPATTVCCKCEGVARIAFVAHEGMAEDDMPVTPRTQIQYVTDMQENIGDGGYWPHDCIAVAVYFCKECLEPTALYNQA